MDPTDKKSRARDLLYAWRMRNKLSQVAAAAAIGFDQAHYSKYERGRSKPGRQHAVRILLGTGGAVPIQAWDEEPTGRGRITERRAS